MSDENKNELFFEYKQSFLQIPSKKAVQKSPKVQMNWICFYLLISVILNPFFGTFEDVKINIFLDFFGLFMPLFFIKKIHKKSFYPFFFLILVLIFQLIYLVYLTKNINVMFQSRMTIYFICQIYLFYCVFSRWSYEYILSLVKVVNYIVIFISVVLLIDFLISDVFILKSTIKEYFFDYRADLYTYFTKLYNGSSPNGIILGPQHSSIISLITCFLFFPLYKNSKINKLKIFLLFPLSFFVFILTMTLTSMICLIFLLIFMSLFAKNTIFYNKYFRIILFGSFSVCMFFWKFFIYLKVGKVNDPLLVQYYIDVFMNPIKKIIVEKNIEKFLLGSGSYPNVWYKSIASEGIHADFGYGMWILSDGIIIVLFITYLFFYTVLFYLKSSIYFIGKNGVYKNTGLLLFPFIFCFITFLSMTHYQTLFQIGIKQLFCFYFSIMLYIIFCRKSLIEKSKSLERSYLL